MKKMCSLIIISFVMLVFVSVCEAGGDNYVTDWISGSEFQAVFQRMSDNRYYTYNVEGRLNGAAIQYRGEFRPVYRELKRWYSFNGMSNEWYEKKKASFDLAGFKELYHNYFFDQTGQRVHQACWIELFER